MMDCYVSPDFLNMAWAAFSDPRIGVITGRILLFDPDAAPVAIQTSETPGRSGQVRCCAPGEIHGAAWRTAAPRPLRRAGLIRCSGLEHPSPPRILILGYVSWLLVGTPHSCRNYSSITTMAGKKVDATRLVRGYRIGTGAVYTKALVDLRTMRRKVLYAWGAQQYRLLRTEPSLLFYEYYGAIRYLASRLLSRRTGGRLE